MTFTFDGHHGYYIFPECRSHRELRIMPAVSVYFLNLLSFKMSEHVLCYVQSQRLDYFYQQLIIETAETIISYLLKCNTVSY